MLLFRLHILPGRGQANSCELCDIFMRELTMASPPNRNNGHQDRVHSDWR